MRRSFIAVLGVLIVLVVPATASAAGSWFSRAAFPTTQTQDGEYPFVQVGPDGPRACWDAGEPPAAGLALLWCSPVR